MSVGNRTLLTGGAGFLGSNVCARLLREGFEVVCLDNLLTGSRNNIEALRAEPGFTFLEGDVTVPIQVDGSLEYVVHFASPASPKDYWAHPIHTLKVGALGTLHSLGLAKSKGAVFFLASSSEIYGDPAVNPQPETYWGHVNPVGPRSIYDEAKRYAEAITMAYRRVHGLRVRIARIFNTYGPGMQLDDGRVIPNFMAQALQSEPLTIYGDGRQTRSFCYVDDLIEGVFRLLTLPEERIPEGEDTGPVFNLGNPDEATILDLAHDVLEVTGSASPIAFEEASPGDPQVRRPDITKARTILGWEPAVSRAEGLRRVVPYFQERLAAAKASSGM